MGGVSFYSRASRGGNAGLRKEREVTAWRGGRASVRSRGTEARQQQVV
jgi:hypothetical protein